MLTEKNWDDVRAKYQVNITAQYATFTLRSDVMCSGRLEYMEQTTPNGLSQNSV